MNIVFGIYKKLIMIKQLIIFIDLTRLNKPIGFMLLFWPCSWGLALGYDFALGANKFLYFLLLFFLGSVLMRSAGCIINDVVDKDLDQKVLRTKNRPVAANKITIQRSLIYATGLCLTAFVILMQFNNQTIILGFGSMFLAFTYPFMKRITFWPQLFLGLTFNWGVIMSWSSINTTFSSDVILLYIAAIFWTLGYDTIYGAQDIADDEIIGVKSTSIKFKNNIKKFVSLCYLISSILIIHIFLNKMTINIGTFLLVFFVITLIFQIIIFDKNNSLSCLRAFKTNNLSGLIVFLGITVLRI